MKTGIGHSKHCIPQPFSRCLISLYTGLFYFNSIFTTEVKLSEYVFKLGKGFKSLNHFLLILNK